MSITNYCECDNTHDSVRTVCQYCYEKGIRYSPCPDDDEYPCYRCGEETGNGYDDGVCAQCGADEDCDEDNNLYYHY